MAGAQVGRECKAYLNTNTYASPTWTLMTQVIDLSYSISGSRGSLNSRASIWNMEGKALNGLEVTFGYRYRQGVTDAVYDDLVDAALGEDKLEIAIADGLINTNTTKYLRATFQIEGGKNQNLEDGVSDDFTAFLTYAEDNGVLREPTWVEVGA